MKNYKVLIPVLLVVLFCLSFYSLFDGKKEFNDEYTKYIAKAEELREEKIFVDACKLYKDAYDMKASPELGIEIGKTYIEWENYFAAEDWGEFLIESYPKDIRPYEFMLEYYYSRKDYSSCFEIFDSLKKRGLSSDYTEEKAEEIKFFFFLDGDYAEAGDFSEEVFPQTNGKLWGYTYYDGSGAVNNMFKEAGAFNEGLAPVVDNEDSVYYIDKSGNRKKVITAVDGITELGTVYDGFFTAETPEGWGIYNEKEEKIIGGYNDLSSVKNGIAAGLYGGAWTVLNMKGEDMTGYSYEKIIMDGNKNVYENERLFVFYNGAYHMIDAKGSEYGIPYEDARLFTGPDTYAAVKTGGLWGYADKNGDMVIEPCYEDARSFSAGIAAAKYNGLWGYISDKNNTLIDYQFDAAGDFISKGCSLVKEQGEEKWTILKLYKYNH